MKDSLKPFGAGIAGWILGLLVLFGLAWPLSKPDTVANAFMWMIERWWAAFALGFVVLIITALRKKIALKASMVAYLLPVGIMLALALACVWIYPNSGFREDLLSYMPVTVVFYVMSWIWISIGKNKQPDLIKASTPPLFGGIMILALVAVPVFRSNAFIYRNAFTLDVSDFQVSGQTMVANCTLEIHKPGNYEFRSPPLYYFEVIYPELIGQDQAPDVELQWGAAGKPAAGATGKYPLAINWKNIPEHELMPSPELFSESMPILLEVHAEGNPGDVLYTLSGLLPANPENAEQRE